MNNINAHIGDKLLCKNNYCGVFNKCEYYYIEDVVTSSIHNLIYYIIGKNNIIYPIFDYHFFHSHFYTKKEERNIKLTKLNEKTEY